jgi:hypothetical protein
MHNFNQKLLQAGFTKALEDKAVFTGLANSSFSGQINQKNDIVKIMQVGNVDITAYSSSDITVQSIADAAREIIADQDYYWSFSLDTLEFNNVKGALMQEYMRKAGYAANNSIDEFLAGKYAQAGIVQNTNAAPVDMTSLNVGDQFLEMGERFAVAGVPRNTAKAALILPWVTTKLALDAAAIKTENAAVYGSGYIGTAHGWNFVESNNVSVGTASTGAKTRIMCIVPGESLGYASAVSLVESMPMQERIGQTQVSGRFIYGGKVVRPDMTGVLYADKTAEA